MNDDEIRALIHEIITERTMPRVFSFPKDDWLVPRYRLLDDYEAFDARFARLEERLAALEQKVKP